MALSENSKPAALVTGATGFVGGRLVHALLQQGHQVTCLVRKTSNARLLRKTPVRLVAGDLDDRESMREAVRGINTVYHVAGAIKAADREGYFRTNQAGTRRLLETLSEANPGPIRFIHISSLAAAGPSRDGHRLTEQEKPNPISWYGESKLEGEREALKYVGSFKVTILRPSAVYGPGDRETLLIFRMIKKGCLFTPGRFIRRFSLIHVDDLADAIWRSGEQPTPSGEVFFVSRPESYTWDDIGRTIAQTLGRNYRRIAFPEWLAIMAGFAGDFWSNLSRRPATISTQKVRELLQPSWLCNPSKLWKQLGITPKVDLEHGIRSTVHWYQDQEWL